MMRHGFPPPCERYCDRRRVVVLRDRRAGPSEFRGKNPREREVAVIEIDGCCIENQEACDFLLLADDTDAWLIELKGSDVAKAIRQIHATLDSIEGRLRPRQIRARVIATRTPSPNILGSDEIKLRRRLGGQDRYRCQTRTMEETL